MSRLPLAFVAILPALHLSACCCFDLPARNFERFECRAKQSEAKSNLKSLYVAQASYFAEHGRYGASLEEVGFEPGGETIRYEYVLVSNGESGFVAEARGLDEMTGDLWQIDEGGEPRALRNVCARWEGTEDTGSGPVEVRYDATERLEVRRSAVVRY